MNSLPLTSENLIRLIVSSFETQSFSIEPFEPRRPGLSRMRYQKVIRELTLSFDYLQQNQSVDLAKYVDKAIQIGSTLYISGAPHLEWKMWLAYTAFGYCLHDEYDRARSYAVLANEWPFLKAIPYHEGSERDIADTIVAGLVGCDVRVPVKTNDSAYDRAMLTLLHSIPNGDHQAIGAAFEVIGEFWVEMALYLQDPNPEYYPQFEPALCALATLAYRNGYRPDGLSEEVRQFLDPGFSELKDQPIFHQGNTTI